MRGTLNEAPVEIEMSGAELDGIFIFIKYTKYTKASSCVLSFVK
jgi:hypothetical protein